MLGCVLVLFTVLVGRILSLQLVDSDRGAAFLKNQGAMRTVRSAELPAYRGVITDRRGEPLAVSTPVISLWAQPAVLAASGRVAELAGVLGQEPAELQSRLARYRGKQFMYLRRHMVPDAARAVLALNIDGVRPEPEYRRFYPAGEVAAQLVGALRIPAAQGAGLDRNTPRADAVRGSPGPRRR